MTSTATLVITGTPDWTESIAQALKDYTVKQYQERGSGYVARLADDGAAMIVVDGNDADWRFWTTTPKSSPATRRIPIVLVSADSERRAEALIAGADFSIAPDELTTQLPGLVNDHARILDPAVIEQLECECQEALPALGQAGIVKFNAGEYYPQHDLFEELWMATEGPVRNLYQAILQVGIGYYQITRGNHRGALKMLLRSVQWISMLPDVCQGVDVKQLREDSYRVRAELERMPPENIDQFDRALLKPVQTVETEK
jgi:uncharacterized protein